MKKGVGINVGSSSILMIFVLLTLTTFSALSLVSANADYKLSTKAADSVTRYYAADARAQTMLGQVDATLRQTAAQADSFEFANALSVALGQEFFVEPHGEEILISYQVPLDDRRALFVQLTAAYPVTDSAARWRLDMWQVVQTGEWVGEDTIHLWDGEMAGIS